MCGRGALVRGGAQERRREGKENTSSSYMARLTKDEWSLYPIVVVPLLPMHLLPWDPPRHPALRLLLPLAQVSAASLPTRV